MDPLAHCAAQPAAQLAACKDPPTTSPATHRSPRSRDVTPQLPLTAESSTFNQPLQFPQSSCSTPEPVIKKKRRSVQVAAGPSKKHRTHR